jgi:hypothetical protein
MNDEQKQLLFDVYYLARFNRDVALALGARAGRLDTAATLAVVLAVVGSLISGGLSFQGSAKLEPLWAVLNIIATGCSIWALIRAYSQQRFEHDDLARRFEALMLRVETYSGYAARVSGVTLNDIDQKAVELRIQYNQLMENAGAAHRRFADAHEQTIRRRLDDSLRREGKL